jgi:uncharacterized protein YuzE
MKITYDNEADACYIYFTNIGVGGVSETIAYEPLAVDLDANDQIVRLRFDESEACKFHKRTRYLVEHPEVEYFEIGCNLHINFSQAPVVERTVPWDGNIDLDRDGQIVGLELLFDPPDYNPDDGIRRLSVADKLEHMRKFIVPFDDVH